jgi:hypothetical protein
VAGLVIGQQVVCLTFYDHVTSNAMQSLEEVVKKTALFRSIRVGGCAWQKSYMTSQFIKPIQTNNLEGIKVGSVRAGDRGAAECQVAAAGATYLQLASDAPQTLGSICCAREQRYTMKLQCRDCRQRLPAMGMMIGTEQDALGRIEQISRFPVHG